MLQVVLVFNDKDQLYHMSGGPLLRVFTTTEWKQFVTAQPPSEKAFYVKWADLARKTPLAVVSMAAVGYAT